MPQKENNYNDEPKIIINIEKLKEFNQEEKRQRQAPTQIIRLSELQGDSVARTKARENAAIQNKLAITTIIGATVISIAGIITLFVNKSKANPALDDIAKTMGTTDNRSSVELPTSPSAIQSSENSALSAAPSVSVSATGTPTITVPSAQIPKQWPKPTIKSSPSQNPPAEKGGIIREVPF